MLFSLVNLELTVARVLSKISLAGNRLSQNALIKGGNPEIYTQKASAFSQLVL